MLYRVRNRHVYVCVCVQGCVAQADHSMHRVFLDSDVTGIVSRSDVLAQVETKLHCLVNSSNTTQTETLYIRDHGQLKVTAQ